MSERDEALKLARETIDGGGCCNSAPLARALLAEHERATKLERALRLIADGAPMPAEWGEQPRGINAYHVAVAKAALDDGGAP